MMITKYCLLAIYILLSGFLFGQKETTRKEVLLADTKTPEDFLSQAFFTDAAEYKSGDTIEYTSGDLFKTKEKHALIILVNSSLEAIYSLYQFQNNHWKLVLSDTGDAGEGLFYQLEDFDFDGVSDFAFCTTASVHGNTWYTLYLNKNNQFTRCPSFTEISNPEPDAAEKHIKSLTLGGVYDQHSKTIYQFRETEYVVVEKITMDPYYGRGSDPAGNTICYYKEEKRVLKQQFCKKIKNGKSTALYDKLIPMY